jgi:hypothetical protein
MVATPPLSTSHPEHAPVRRELVRAGVAVWLLLVGAAVERSLVPAAVETGRIEAFQAQLRLS